MGTAWGVRSNDQAVRFRFLDNAVTGAVDIKEYAEQTGLFCPDLPESMIYRLVCIYLINRLTEKSLLEVTETLLDVYNWQTKKEQINRQISYVTTAPVLGIRNVASRPPAFND